MKKIIDIDKLIEFPSMIGEITAITVDNKLKYKDCNNIVGSLIVKGKYKRTEASRLEEEFSFELPTEILLTEKLDLQTTKVEIEDFYYEIKDDETLNCHISLLVEGMEVVELEDEKILEEHDIKIEEIVNETSKEDRECDGDTTYQEEFIPKEEKKNDKLETEENITPPSVFTSISSEETFSTYSIYIIREEETIEKILAKYKITKEELEQYNDLSNLSIGTKVIIPIPKNEN